MPKLAVLSYSLDEDETEFVNGLWTWLNTPRTKHFGFRYHFRYTQGEWKIYLAFVNEESYQSAKKNISNRGRLEGNALCEKYSSIFFMEDSI